MSETVHNKTARSAPEYNTKFVQPKVREMGSVVLDLHASSVGVRDNLPSVAVWWQHPTTLVRGNNENGFSFAVNDRGRPPVIYNVDYKHTRSVNRGVIGNLSLVVRHPVPQRPEERGKEPRIASIGFDWGVNTKGETRPTEYPKDIPLTLLDRFEEDITTLRGLVVVRRKEAQAQFDLTAGASPTMRIGDARAVRTMPHETEEPIEAVEYTGDGVITEPENSELIGG